MQLTPLLVQSYLRWVRPDLSEQKLLEELSRRQRALQSNPNELANTRLIVEQNIIRASVAYFPLGDQNYLLGPLKVRTKDDQPKARQLLTEIMTHIREQGIQRLSSRVDVNDDFPLYQEALQAEGFQKAGGRVEFKTPIEELPREGPHQIQWRNLDQIGEQEAGRLLEDVGQDAPDWEGDVGPDLLRAYFSDPVLTKGPHCVHVGYLEGKAMGIVIAQVDERDGWSRLTYMGVTRNFRGRGLGGVIHRHGFTMMREQGGTHYHGGCSLDNEPMIALFHRHNCRELRRVIEWRWKPSILL